MAEIVELYWETLVSRLWKMTVTHRGGDILISLEKIV